MNNTEVLYLIDILNLINYNINSILDPQNNIDIVIKHHKNSIVTTIRTLEKNKHWEYLYICILLISSRICDDAIRTYLVVPSLSNVATDNTDAHSVNDSVVFFKRQDITVKYKLFILEFSNVSD